MRISGLNRRNIIDNRRLGRLRRLFVNCWLWLLFDGLASTGADVESGLGTGDPPTAVAASLRASTIATPRLLRWSKISDSDFPHWQALSLKTFGREAELSLAHFPLLARQVSY